MGRRDTDYKLLWHASISVSHISGTFYCSCIHPQEVSCPSKPSLRMHSWHAMWLRSSNLLVHLAIAPILKMTIGLPQLLKVPYKLKFTFHYTPTSMPAYWIPLQKWHLRINNTNHRKFEFPWRESLTCRYGWVYLKAESVSESQAQIQTIFDFNFNYRLEPCYLE